MTSKKVGCGCKVKEEQKHALGELRTFYDSISSSGVRVTRKKPARELFRLLNDFDVTPTVETIRATTAVVGRWKRSQGLTIRRVTHVSQHIHHDEHLIKNWVKMINGNIACYKVLPDCVVNIDETDVNYDMAEGGTTITNAGARTVTVKSRQVIDAQ